MDGFPRIQLIGDPFQSLCLTETTSPFLPKALPFFEEHCDDLILHSPLLAPASFESFDTVTDLIQIQQTTLPFFSSHRAMVEQRVGSLRSAVESAHLGALTDRVSALEKRFDRLVNAAERRDGKYSWKAEIKGNGGYERKYKLTKEIKGSGKTRCHGEDHRNYKWMSEIKGGKGQSSQKKVVEVEEEGGRLKNFKWTVDIKDKEDGDGAPTKRTYSYKASAVGGAADSGSKEKKEKEEEKVEKKQKEDKKKEEIDTRVVHIEEPSDHGVIVLKQAFARRRGADLRCKGKKKDLTPQDAALMIQETFKAYLIRRSQALRALRALAVAKAKLKEVRALFSNFSYRKRIERDLEERQKFAEKIIVLLLTVDAVEGADLMVRSSKRSMVDELEAMLDVVDPQPTGKSLSMKRRTFNMPSGAFQNEIAAGVTKLVQIIDQDENGSTAFEACL